MSSLTWAKQAGENIENPILALNYELKEEKQT